MVTTDPIADLFTRIRNGYLAHLDEVTVPHSKLKEAVLSVLHKGQFVENVQVVEQKGRKQFVVTLRYDGKRPAVTRIERVSTPGRRAYVGADKIPSVLGGMGIAIVSTPAGVMTGKEAKSKHVGGELLGRVW
jgi:small subunit ribosomal protein S8